MFIINGAYYSNSEVDKPNNNKPIFVTSAGHHTLIKRASFDTVRSKGRQDYQLLYVKKGKIYYTIDGVTKICQEDSILFYYPHEPQFYIYYLEDSSDIYWCHFTGYAVEEILTSLHLNGNRCHAVINSDEFTNCFDHIIREFQIKATHYEELANLYFRELLHLFSRQLKADYNEKKASYSEINIAISYFNTHFNEEIDMDEYVKSLNISTSWFTQLFRQQTNTTPHKYLSNLRINKAKSLLCSNASISEIAYIVGFTDPLYFSRVFRQASGMSPSEFKKKHFNLNVCPEDDAPWQKKNII